MATYEPLPLPMPVTTPCSASTPVVFPELSPTNNRLDLRRSPVQGETDDIMSTKPAAAGGQQVLHMDHLRGDNVGGGWTEHTPPHRDSTYFYNSDLKLVTTENMRNQNIRSKILSKFRENVDKSHPSETWVYADNHLVVNHATEMLGDPENLDESRANYWIYLHNFPCHYKLSYHAEREALTLLQLMMAKILTNTDGSACTPFSMQDIQQSIEFFNFSKTLDNSNDDMPIAKTIIITNIIANFYKYRTLNSTSSSIPEGGTEPMSLSKTVITVACWGMPPNYLRRFDAAYNVYQQTLQPAGWISFLEQVRKERAAANVVSGLLLASSVGFLGIPSLDVARCFIIVSIGLSLGCVVMGFNGQVDEELSELQYISIAPQTLSESKKRVTRIGRALEQHYIMLLLSVLCFFLSVFAFTTYSIYTSVFVAKSFTIRYLFYVMATGGLVITMVTITRWNRQFV